MKTDNGCKLECLFMCEKAEDANILEEVKRELNKCAKDINLTNSLCKLEKQVDTDKIGTLMIENFSKLDK